MPQFFYGMVVISLLCMVGDGRMWGGRWEGGRALHWGDVGRARARCWEVLGGCLEGVGRVFGGCWEGVGTWEGVGRVLGGCWEDIVIS